MFVESLSAIILMAVIAYLQLNNIFLINVCDPVPFYTLQSFK